MQSYHECCIIYVALFRRHPNLAQYVSSQESRWQSVWLSPLAPFNLTAQRCAQRCSSAKQLMARYLHTFLFRCPHCGEPVEVARKSDEAACEQLDAEPFSLVCLSCRKLFG